jgi:hypothetical protein
MMKKVMNVLSKISIVGLFAIAAMVQPMSLFIWGTPEAPEEIFK